MKSSSIKIAALAALTASSGSLLADASLNYQNTVRQTVHATTETPEVVMDMEDVPAFGEDTALLAMQSSGTTFELLSLHKPSNSEYLLDSKYVGPKSAEIFIDSSDPFSYKGDEDGDGIQDGWPRTRRDMPFGISTEIRLPEGSLATADMLIMQWNGFVNGQGNHDYETHDKNVDYSVNRIQLGKFAETAEFSHSFSKGSNLGDVGDAGFNSGAPGYSGFEVFSVWSLEGEKLATAQVQVLPVATGVVTHSNGQAFTGVPTFDANTDISGVVYDTYPDSVTRVVVTDEKGVKTDLGSYANPSNSPRDWEFSVERILDYFTESGSFTMQVTTQAPFDSEPQLVSQVSFNLELGIKIRGGVHTN